MAKAKKSLMAKNQAEAIVSMQEDPDYIVGQNALANVKFGIRQTNGTVKNAKANIHIPKVFWEVVSQLTLNDLETTDSLIKKHLNIGELVSKMGTEGHYKYVIDAARMLRSWEVMLIDEEGNEHYEGFFAGVSHELKSGILEVRIAKRWATYILDVVNKGNFSFQKNFVLVLQNISAVRLYPFFKSWLNKGVYDTSLERFKKDFGYDTTGYSRFAHLKNYVLDPAMREINEKTDILLRYDLIGENLEGIRPRISGLRFFIKAKEKTDPKQLEAPKAVERPQKPTDEPQHISQVIQAKTPQSPQKPNTSEIEPSFQDIRNLVNDSILRDAEIEELIKDFGYIQTWERIKGFKIANVNQQIKVPFAYIIKAQSLGVGLWEQQKAQKAKKQAEAENQQIKEIHEDYSNRKNKYFETVYDQATEAEQAQVMQAILEKEPNMKMIYLREDKPTTLLKRKTGQLLVEELYTDEDIRSKGLLTKKARQHNFRNTTFEKIGIQIDFDVNDTVIKSSLFDEAQATIEPPKVEVVEPQSKTPKKPRATRPKQPQTQKPIEPIPVQIESKQEQEPAPKKKLWERIWGR